jgi:hypothetical protein
MKSTQPAPRESASMPSAPVPANKSRQRAPSMIGASQLNSVSRTRSGVGRRPGASGTSSRDRRRLPPMMRTDPNAGLGAARGMETDV